MYYVCLQDRQETINNNNSVEETEAFIKIGEMHARAWKMIVIANLN